MRQKINASKKTFANKNFSASSSHFQIKKLIKEGSGDVSDFIDQKEIKKAKRVLGRGNSVQLPQPEAVKADNFLLSKELKGPTLKPKSKFSKKKVSSKSVSSG